MSRASVVVGITALGVVCLSACSGSDDLLAASSAAQSAAVGAAWGPEEPPFNLEAVLRGDGFGLVSFRQPNDEDKIVYLDVWVRDLLPDTSYSLQRAVDTTIDGDCTGTNWLTLGEGTTPASIVTDEGGTGRASLWRDLAAVATGAEFDIHFRIIQNGTIPVVIPLESGCYQFVLTQ